MEKQKLYLLENDAKMMLGIMFQGIELSVDYAKKQLKHINDNIDINDYYEVHQVTIRQYIEKLKEIINNKGVNNK